ncbi:MAG: oligosaccharide repeat unit polymerase [Planctomycetes bacterium]|nr:oligosaccharide repeat unit polymerase [Planctomycetota bacterium]
MLVGVGLLLLLHAVVMAAVYLLQERGSMLDPVFISWAGCGLFIGGGMFFTGIFLPERGRESVALPCVLMMLVGTVCYTIGLYLGKQKSLARAIPTPQAVLTDAQIWMMWLVSVVSFFSSCGLLLVVPPQSALFNPLKGLVDGSMGAAALLSVMVLVGYRGRLPTKAVMILTLASVAALTLAWSWSRRPLVGVLVAAGAYFYRARIAHRSLNTRVLVLTAVVVCSALLVLYLGGTRGRRFHGKAGGEYEILSAQNYMDFLAGVTINYEVAEFAVQEIPSTRSYLWGSGFVPAFTFWIPRAIWSSKPVGTGWVVTTMWYHTEHPDNNLALTIIGEWYANFGYFGVAVGMLLIGIIVRTINTWMRSNINNKVLWPAWLLVLPDFATEWRGDFTSMTVQGLLRIMMFLFLAWAAGKMASKPAPRMTAGPPRRGRPAPANVVRAIRATRPPSAFGP